MPRPARLIAPACIAMVLSACSFSFSVGGLDYSALEEAITDELNTTYASINRSVDAVDCPELADTPETGDTLVCTADLEGQNVRVEAMIEDDDFNVNFATLDTVYDLPQTAEVLESDISETIGSPVAINCGDGFTVVANGDTFLCTGTDTSGESATIQVTANGPDDAGWEILD